MLRRRPAIFDMQDHTQPLGLHLPCNNTQCTHMTVTRLYTQEFCCSTCLRIPPLGWLYRCTQDRELLLEDDLEHDVAVQMDNLYDIFELPTSPPKRSPVARLDPLSFLDEITEEQLKTYSKEQLKLILKQRAQVLDIASAASDSKNSTNLYFRESYRQSPFNSACPGPGLPKVQQKSWLPLKGGECQFKCCHFCRRHLNERSYLSLNGIADGDLPYTATTGFGFHLLKRRPVALVKHVKNLGLRTIPSPMSFSLTYPPVQNYLETGQDAKQENGDIFTRNTPSNPYIAKRIFPASSGSSISTGGRLDTGQSLDISVKDISYSALGTIISPTKAKARPQIPIDMAIKSHLAELKTIPISITPVSKTLSPNDKPYISIYQTLRSLPEMPLSKTVFEHVTDLIESGELGKSRKSPLPRMDNNTNTLSRRSVEIQGLSRDGEENATLMAVEGGEIQENGKETLLEMSRMKEYETGLENEAEVQEAVI